MPDKRKSTHIDRPIRPLLARFDWDDIRVFLALARQRTLSAAARFLSVNHATVGRRVTALEQALETKLFERTSDGFLLTDSGDRLLEDAEGIESHILGISNEFSGEIKEFGGTVRIGTMEGIGSLFIAPRVRHLLSAYPALKVELVTAPHWINLSKREADILVSFPKPQGNRISVEKVGEFALFLYASQEFIAEHGAPEKPEDLTRFNFLDYIHELVHISAVRWLSEAVNDTASSFTSTSLIAQYHSAVSGTGIAMLPTFVAEPDPRLVRLMPNHVKVMREVWLAVHNDIAHVVRVRQAVKFLRQLFIDNRECLIGEKPFASY